MNSATLAQGLERQNNNFDLLRLIAALGVIVGHAYYLAPTSPGQDLLHHVVGFDYLGSIGVRFFFFLSGLVVAVSLLRDPNIIRFSTRRAARLFPALLICNVLTALVIGAAISNVGFAQYFTSTQVWTYIASNTALINLQWTLPGVFTQNAFTQGVNGSLWTLPIEIICYTWLAVAALAVLAWQVITKSTDKSSNHKLIKWMLLLGSAVVIALTLWSPAVLPFGGEGRYTGYLGFCFALGVICAVLAHHIKLTWRGLLLCVGLLLLLRDTVWLQPALYIAMAYGALWIAVQQWFIRLKPSFDASYGVYLYGFVIQQVLVATLPGLNIWLHMAIAGVCALAIGVASWVLIEKPVLNWVSGKLKGQSSNHTNTAGVHSGTMSSAQS